MMQDRAFEEFVRVYYRSLVRTAYRLVGDEHLANDIVQTSMLNMYRARRRVDWDHARRYALKVVTNSSIDYLRSPAHRRTDYYGSADDLDQVVGTPSVDSEGDYRVAAALEALQPRVRAAVVLHYYEDLSTEEIAKTLHYSDRQVRRLLEVGRTQLARVLTTPGLEAS